MKLSSVVSFYNTISQSGVVNICENTERELAGVMQKLAIKNIDTLGYQHRLIKQYNKVSAGMRQFTDLHNSFGVELQKIIAKLEKPLYQQIEQVYAENIKYETNETIFSKKLNTDSDTKTLLKDRLKNYTDWRWPGMIFRPGIEDFIDDLVALDPLYVVDHNRTLLEPALNRFNESYRSRLRDYIITEDAKQILGNLPNDQFGTVFAYNFFNYKPMSIVIRYLEEIYQKLRPGGTLIFSFNNCDLSHAARLAEMKLMSYTPAKALKQHAEKIGYCLIFQHNGQGDLYWLELQKPGKLTSLRGGQTLAKIMPK